MTFKLQHCQESNNLPSHWLRLQWHRGLTYPEKDLHLKQTQPYLVLRSFLSFFENSKFYFLSFSLHTPIYLFVYWFVWLYIISIAKLRYVIYQQLEWYYNTFTWNHHIQSKIIWQPTFICSVISCTRVLQKRAAFFLGMAISLSLSSTQ